MAVTFARIHNELYHVQNDGVHIGEVDRETGNWVVTYKGRRINGISFIDLYDAKQFVKNKVLSEYIPEPFDEGC